MFVNYQEDILSFPYSVGEHVLGAHREHQLAAHPVAQHVPPVLVHTPAIELTATLRDANLQLGEIALRGTLGVAVGIRDVLDAPSGLAELDATEAELGYANFFTKAPGAVLVGLRRRVQIPSA